MNTNNTLPASQRAALQEAQDRVDYLRTKAIQNANEVKEMMDTYIRRLEDESDPRGPGINYMEHNALFRSMGEFNEAVRSLHRLKYVLGVD